MLCAAFYLFLIQHVRACVCMCVCVCVRNHWHGVDGSQESREEADRRSVFVQNVRPLCFLFFSCAAVDLWLILKQRDRGTERQRQIEPHTSHRRGMHHMHAHTRAHSWLGRWTTLHLRQICRRSLVRAAPCGASPLVASPRGSQRGTRTSSLPTRRPSMLQRPFQTRCSRADKSRCVRACMCLCLCVPVCVCVSECLVVWGAVRHASEGVKATGLRILLLLFFVCCGCSSGFFHTRSLFCSLHAGAAEAHEHPRPPQARSGPRARARALPRLQGTKGTCKVSDAVWLLVRARAHSFTHSLTHPPTIIPFLWLRHVSSIHHLLVRAICRARGHAVYFSTQ